MLIITDSSVGNPSGPEEESELDNWDNESAEQGLVESSTQIELKLKIKLNLVSI